MGNTATHYCVKESTQHIQRIHYENIEIEKENEALKQQIIKQQQKYKELKQLQDTQTLSTKSSNCTYSSFKSLPLNQTHNNNTTNAKTYDSSDTDTYASYNPDDDISLSFIHPSKDHSINNCKYVETLLNQLCFYATLNLPSETETLMTFISDKCKTENLMDAFIHIVLSHNSSEEIHNILTIVGNKYNMTECDIIHCKILIRPASNNGTFNDLEYAFWRDLFDAIHRFIYHSFDFSFRITNNDFNMNEDYNDNIQENDECHFIDNKFKALHSIIVNKRRILDQIKGLKGLNPNKYNIHINATNNCSSNIVNIDGLYTYNNNTNVTWIDGLYPYIIRHEIDETQLTKLQNYINEQQYDSDTILNDLQNYSQNKSNIVHSINDKMCSDLIQDYIYLTASFHSINIDYVFYYWPYYKKLQEQQPQQPLNNTQTHEIYISTKYKSLKQELLNNLVHSIDINHWKCASMKAHKYINTKMIKLTKAYFSQDLHYDMKQGSLMSISHLLSSIFYCDFYSLSQSFTCTFHAIMSYESISSIKKRNTEFAIWSRLIQETVTYFGNQSQTKIFCTTSGEMIITNVKFYAPTMTTNRLEVITRYANDNGIIIEIEASNCSTFNCSWISAHNAENEQLLVGNKSITPIKTIILITSKENYSKYIEIFNCFNDMINDTTTEYLRYFYITKWHYSILFNLIYVENNKYDLYINNTWNVFKNNTQKLTLNLYYINQHFSLLKDLILSHNNLFKEIVFKLFKNINHIVIDTSPVTFTEYDIQYSKNIITTHKYEICFESLLSILDSFFTPNKLKVTVKATYEDKDSEHDIVSNYSNTTDNKSVDSIITNKKENERSWISQLDLQILQTTYENKGWTISREIEMSNCQDYVRISKQ